MATVITVVPRAIPVTLTTAADEIVSYVEKMSGAKLGRGNAPPGGTRILLEVAPAAVHEEDAFRIVTAPGAIRLIGGGEAGVLYAAYALLEDLGVRWLVPGDEGEVVPSRRNVAYSQTDRTETPRFRCRFFYVGSPDALRWAVRNRLNGFFNQPFALAHGNGYYLPPMVDSIRSFVASCRRSNILPPIRNTTRS